LGQGLFSHWGELAGAPNLPAHVLKFGDASPGRVFVGDRPAWSFSRETKFILQSDAVDFDHDAIDLIGKRGPLGLELVDEFEHLVDISRRSMIGIYFEAGR
jgi:hypothetical protein